MIRRGSHLASAVPCVRLGAGSHSNPRAPRIVVSAPPSRHVPLPRGPGGTGRRREAHRVVQPDPRGIPAMRPRPGHRASVARGRRRRRVRGVLRRSTGRAAPRGPRLVRGQAPQGRRGRCRGSDAKEGGRFHHRRRAAGARQRVGRRPPRHLRAHLPRRLARALAQARIRAVPRALAPDRPRTHRHPAPAPRPYPGQNRGAPGVDARAAARGVHRAVRRRGGPRDGPHGVAAGVREGGEGDTGPGMGRDSREGVCRGARGLAVARRAVRGVRANVGQTP